MGLWRHAGWSESLLGSCPKVHSDNAACYIPFLGNHCISADAMQHSSSIATASRTQIWPCRKKVKGHPRIIIWKKKQKNNKLCRSCVPDIIYQDSASKLSWFKRKRFLSVFSPYMGMAAILFSGAEPFEQIVISLTEGPIWNLVKIGQTVSEKIFLDFSTLYMYKAKGQGQITSQGQNFHCN